MKSGLGLRPIDHRAERRIRAQVPLTVLALLLERMVELMVGDRWHNIRHDLAGIKLVDLLGLEGTIWQVTEPRPVAAKHLSAREIASPLKSLVPELLEVTRETQASRSASSGTSRCRPPSRNSTMRHEVVSEERGEGGSYFSIWGAIGRAGFT